MRSLAFVAALVGCGSNRPPDTTTPTDPTTAPTGEFPSGPPLVTPGERMVYRVQLQGIELAAMTFAVGDTTELGGKKAIVVQGHAKSVGLANLVAAIDDTFTSWIDVETGRSLRFTVDEFVTNSKTNIEHTIVDLAGRAGDQVPITFALNDAPPTPEPQKFKYPEAWDYNAFLIALRAWEGPIGTTQKLEVLRSRWLWHMEVKIGRKEQLATELGDLPALRFDAHVFKLDRAGNKDTTSEERDFSVWVSDDDGRVPIQINARTDYGDVKMQIVEYQPGTGQRLRP